MRSKTVELEIRAKDRASKVIGRIGSGLKSLGVAAVKISGIMVAGFAAASAALTALYAKLADSIDEQAKMAASLGIANDKLGVYRDAAGYAGVATGDLNTALRKMSQGIADAANGTGEAQDALKALGLDAEKLRKAGPEAAFEAIIEKLSKIPNGIQKTALAMDLFGRSGSSMANLTSEGLKQAQKDADDLGLKLTSSQAGLVESANDAWARVKNAAGDFLKYIAASIAPGIKTAFDGAFEFIKKQDLKKWAADAAYGMAKGFEGTLTVLGAVGEAVIAISRGFTEVSSVANKIIGGLGAMKVAGTENAITQYKKMIEELQAGPQDEGTQKRIAHFQRELATAEQVLAKYKGIADTAVNIDDKLTAVSNTLSKSQGFSDNPKVKQAMEGLRKISEDLADKSHLVGENTEKAAEKVTVSTDKMIQQYGLVAGQAERLGGVLERLASKEWVVNVKVNKYGQDGVENLADSLDAGADR